eukprot:4343152-Amphidinium_carterae.2
MIRSSAEYACTGVTHVTFSTDGAMTLEPLYLPNDCLLFGYASLLWIREKGTCSRSTSRWPRTLLQQLLPWVTRSGNYVALLSCVCSSGLGHSPSILTLRARFYALEAASLGTMQIFAPFFDAVPNPSSCGGHRKSVAEKFVKIGQFVCFFWASEAILPL